MLKAMGIKPESTVSGNVVWGNKRNFIAGK